MSPFISKLYHINKFFLNSHRILNVRPNSWHHLKYLRQLENVDFWNDIGRNSNGIDLRLTPDMEEIIRNELNRLNIPYSVYKDDAQIKLDAFWNAHMSTTKNKFLVKNYKFDRYLDYSQVSLIITL